MKRLPILLLTLSLGVAHGAATPATTDLSDPAALGAQLARLGGTAFDRGYLSLTVTRLESVESAAEALAKNADDPQLRKLGQSQLDSARKAQTRAQSALKAIGGPDLSLANKAQRGVGGLVGGLTGTEKRKADLDLLAPLISTRGQLLAAAALAVARASSPAALEAARDLLKFEADAYAALRGAQLRLK